MMPDEIFIEDVKQVGTYQLSLTFSDGKETVIDFEGFLKATSNPHIRKYLDITKFQEYSLMDGDLQWNDYDLCFPVADLYENRNIESDKSDVA
ncbi:MAG: DUF2442 domain-containing protein [Halomonas sp.]|uniref:DUF2442 domain-containing protein n=1 Tax=Halomonas sp. TaxID=1486246 RepID=UPI002ACE1E8D|nr:DUF2442 domain-containing protein [Halomonas sp.]MDZ7853025.1 DUF2442 domain-containing protein [Halomonas sp.]